VKENYFKRSFFALVWCVWHHFGAPSIVELIHSFNDIFEAGFCAFCLLKRVFFKVSIKSQGNRSGMIYNLVT